MRTGQSEEFLLVELFEILVEGPYFASSEPVELNTNRVFGSPPHYGSNRDFGIGSRQAKDEVKSRSKWQSLTKGEESTPERQIHDRLSTLGFLERYGGVDADRMAGSTAVFDQGISLCINTSTRPCQRCFS
tara:strand:- start:58193 stop:58585 length:393 start_codon:yes stop_codon:yes gene_type:complete